MEPEVRLLVILKSCPADPSQERVPEFKVSYGIISITVPIPTAPVKGLNCNNVLPIPTTVEIPEVTVTNPIYAVVFVVVSLTVNPPLLLP